MSASAKLIETRKEQLAAAWADSRLDELRNLADAAVNESTFEPSDAAHVSAFVLVDRLGQCELSGADSSLVLSSLPLPIALAATEELVGRVHRWTDRTRQLGSRWWSANDFEREDMCCSMIEHRTSAWGMYRSLQDAFSDEDEGTTWECPRLSVAFEELVDALEDFDAALDSEAVILSTIDDLPLRNNLCDMLRDDLRAELPWWLDGTLSQRAQEIDALGRGWGLVSSSQSEQSITTQLARLANQKAEFSVRRVSGSTTPAGMAADRKPKPLPESLIWYSDCGGYIAMMDVPKNAEGDELSLVICRNNDDETPCSHIMQGPLSKDEKKLCDFSFEMLSLAQREPQQVTLTSIKFSRRELEASETWNWAVLCVDGRAWSRNVA